MAGWVDGVQSPTSSEGLLHFFSPTACAASQLDSVQHHSWLQLLSELEFHLSQIRDDSRQEIRILEVGNMFQTISGESENMRGVREYQESQRISGESKDIRGVREYQGSQRVRIWHIRCLRKSLIFYRPVVSKTVRK
jgi:hypothetical protein